MGTGLPDWIILVVVAEEFSRVYAKEVPFRRGLGAGGGVEAGDDCADRRVPSLVSLGG